MTTFDLKEARKAAGLSRKALATAAAVSEGMIQRWESKGRPPRDVAAANRILAALDIVGPGAPLSAVVPSKPALAIVPQAKPVEAKPAPKKSKSSRCPVEHWLRDSQRFGDSDLAGLARAYIAAGATPAKLARLLEADSVAEVVKGAGRPNDVRRAMFAALRATVSRQ